MLDGGANVSENPLSYTVGSGQITLVNPTRTHYDFIGWTYEGMTTPTMSLTLDTDTEVGDKTFTANWAAKKYNIHYVLSGGVHLGNPTTYTVNDLPLSINSTSKTNSHFIGWFSDSNYTNAISFISSCQDITLYAKFTVGSEGVEYSVNPAGNGYIVTKYTGTDRHVYIANVYEGLPVVEIGEKAFYNQGISGITIPDTVKKIGDYAFYGCASLSDVSIPSSVEFIGTDAFSGCNSISYTEYEGVRYIGDENSPYNVVIGCEAWANSALVLHKDAKIIYSRSFENVPKTVSIELPDGLVMLCDYALSGLSNITSISLPDTLQSIGENAFYGCTYLNYTVSEGAKYLGNESNPYLALISYTGSGDSLIVNPNTKIIYSYALYGATKITKVVLPNTVIYIGERAFGGCTNLTSIDYNGNESEWSKIYIANGFSIKVNCSKQSSDT